MRQTDLAYAAGLIDGEGCITIVRKHVRYGNGFEYRVRLHVANTNQVVLLFLERLLGGKIYTQPKMQSHWKQCWYWYMDGSYAVDALRLVSPYLLAKKAEAQLAIAYWDDADVHKWHKWTPEQRAKIEGLRDAYYVEMRGLKHAPHLFRQPSSVAEILK